MLHIRSESINLVLPEIVIDGFVKPNSHPNF